MVVLRAALYERVSTEEQAKFGYSIKTQIDDLTEYCKKNKIKIVDHYTEEGVSGGKPSFKRPQMARLLEDVKAGQIDIILFTKLDRWFRNVKEYYKVQDILDTHKVEWKAIQEDFDTTTANGRMTITIFLALAQNEREKASERVKAVIRNKIKNKEAFFNGRAMFFGYKNEKDENGIPRLVKDPELKDAVQAYWDMMLKYNNNTKAGRYVNQAFGLSRSQLVWRNVYINPIYTGTYKGVEGYCEPYITLDDWQMLHSQPPIKQAQSNRVYLFTGLMRCPECGCTLKSSHSFKINAKGERKEYMSYRCNKHATNACSYKREVSQNKAEKWMLAHLDTLIEDEIARVELERAKPKPKPKTNIAKLKEQLRRAEVVYMAGNKSDAEYMAEQAEIKAQIAKAELEQSTNANNRDLTPLKELLETDFRTIYEMLDQEDKRRFWRAIIKEIHISGNTVKSIDFF